MVIAQLWALANDLYTQRQGERFFPLLGLGSSLGAWAGAVAATRLIRPAGPYGLMTAAAIVLIICAALTVWINRRHVRTEDPKPRKVAEQPLSREGGFELIFRDRYLMLIAALVVLLNIVNTSGEFLLSKLVVAEATRAFPGAAMAAARAAVHRRVLRFVLRMGEYHRPGSADLLRFADFQGDRSRGLRCS